MAKRRAIEWPQGRWNPLQLVTDGTHPVVIVGIGLNVNGSEFPAELKDIAASLMSAGHEPQDMEKLEEDLIRDLNKALSRYDSRGTPNAMATDITFEWLADG